MSQIDFNLVEGEREKEEGIDAAVGALPAWGTRILEEARVVARMIARARGDVTADDVVAWFKDHDTDLPGRIGNAMGSLFRGEEWYFTGRYVKSARVHAHANLLRVWRLR